MAQALTRELEAFALELADAFEHRGGRHTDTAGDLDVGTAGVGLETFQDSPVDVIQTCDFVHPRIVRHLF